MVKMATIDVKDQDLVGTLQGFLKSVLKQEEISAILAPWRLPMKNMVMPTLVTDPQQLDRVDPLSPAFPLNSAKVVSRLTRKASGSKVAAVMRPCEIRAFIELTKLNQGRMEDLVIIGIDCLGAYRNTDYVRWVGEDVRAATQTYYTAVLNGSGPALDGIEPAPACRACELPLPDGADIAIGLFGMESGSQILVQAQTEKGEPFLKGLHPAGDTPPAARQKAIDKLLEARTTARDDMFAATRAATDNLEKLSGYLANCVNCYNCRVACPVCYCRECVFVTDVFDHEPAQYLRWADQKGAVKMPTDTLFYHLTRLAHMSTACVGCGQCSNACPNDIPVMEIFKSVARDTQAAFDYAAGRNLEERPPLSEFREDEFPEVVGLN
jgi:formate dehydrogenase subunit beta